MNALRLTVVSVACFLVSAQAQILFTTAGTGTNTFNVLPSLDSGWSTLSALPAADSNIMTAEELGIAVQTNSAGFITNALTSSSIYPIPSMPLLAGIR
jgi:hypothetical protein